MTGGLAYVLRTEAEHILNTEFVQPHELEQMEERCLRGLLETHLTLTGSPARVSLLAMPSLPFLRIQPIHFQGTLEGAWKAAAPRIGDWAAHSRCRRKLFRGATQPCSAVRLSPAESLP